MDCGWIGWEIVIMPKAFARILCEQGSFVPFSSYPAKGDTSQERREWLERHLLEGEIGCIWGYRVIARR